MAFSKDVLTVVGMCCVSKQFRSDFLKNPSGTGRELVGRLSDSELAQLEGIAGKRESLLPNGLTRQQYVDRLNIAFDNVFMACDCPRPPCPDGF
jgi:hypothetical protein